MNLQFAICNFSVFQKLSYCVSIHYKVKTDEVTRTTATSTKEFQDRAGDWSQLEPSSSIYLEIIKELANVKTILKSDIK